MFYNIVNGCRMKKFIILIMFYSSTAMAQSFVPVPYTFAPGTAVIPAQLMTNFLSVIASGNAVASALNAKIAAFTFIPTGGLVFFNLNSCPSGWTISSVPNTLFIRGLDNGAGRDPTGAALGTQEIGRMQDHVHNIGNAATGVTPPVNYNALTPISATSNFNFILGTATTTGNPSTGNHGSEVRPANVSLLLCSKN